MEDSMIVKSKIRVAGEVITLINNILITVGSVIAVIIFYLNFYLYNRLTENFIDLNYTYSQFINFFSNSKFLIISTCIIIISLIWTIRAIVITSDSNLIIIIGIILNIGNILALIGYGLILYDNIQTKNEKLKEFQHIEIEDEDIKVNIKQKNIKIYLYLTLALIALITIIVILFVVKSVNTNSTLETPSYNLDINSKTEVINDIKSDYQSKEKEYQQIVTKENGIHRYQSLLIDSLRQYDISSIDNAKIVYDLSDKLLNGMYQDLKNNYVTEDMFNELREEQRVWIKNKENAILNIQDELIKYEILINMTLDRCDEFNNNY